MKKRLRARVRGRGRPKLRYLFLAGVVAVPILLAGCEGSFRPPNQPFEFSRPNGVTVAPLTITYPNWLIREVHLKFDVRGSDIANNRISLVPTGSQYQGHECKRNPAIYAVLPIGDVNDFEMTVPPDCVTWYFETGGSTDVSRMVCSLPTRLGLG